MAKPIVYISGTISNDPGYQEHFQKAEKFLKLQGLEFINPAKLCSVLHQSAKHEDYMDICIKLLDKATHIYMLRGCRESKGATQERAYAIYKGLDFMYENPEWEKANE